MLNTQLIWIPSHTGIYDISIADEMASNSVNGPLEMQAMFQKKDINKIILSYVFEKPDSHSSNYSHFYKQFNPTWKGIIFPSECQRIRIKKYCRLRLGHTLLTDEHYGIDKYTDIYMPTLQYRWFNYHSLRIYVTNTTPTCQSC